MLRIIPTKKFKQIPNFPNYYVSPKGKIWTCNYKKYLSPAVQCGGYYLVSLCKNGKVYRKFIHRLVLETFVGKCPDGMECRHLDGNSTNNNLLNLKWGTRSENTKDSVKHGTFVGNTKLTEQNVKMIIYMHRTQLFTQQGIADIYNISRRSIGRIINKETWKHIWKG